MTKSEKIKQTRLDTLNRRVNQALRVYELKVNCHHTSKEVFNRLRSLFIETKWVQNDVISSEDIFKYNYKDHRTVTVINKDKNKVKRQITLGTQIHQNVVDMIKRDIVNLSKKIKRGEKVGKLKFRRTCNCVPLRTGCFRVKSKKQITIPSFRNLNVYGLEQFISLPDYEIANANVIKKASGIYIKISVLVPKQSMQRKSTGKTIGLDFGIKDNITTSDGEKFNCSVQESDYLKFLQRKLSKKQKGSKRYYKCLNQLQKEYEHLTNKRNDDSNKLISYLKKEYDIIYYQDEQIAKWRKFNRGFAKNIQHSYLGRVKAKLRELSKSERAFEISKWTPSTKYCPQCGSLNDGIQLSDRVFKCNCGYQFDRDVHAAKNVKLFGSTKRAECLEQTSVDKLASIALSM